MALGNLVIEDGKLCMTTGSVIDNARLVIDDATPRPRVTIDGNSYTIDEVEELETVNFEIVEKRNGETHRWTDGCYALDMNGNRISFRNMVFLDGYGVKCSGSATFEYDEELKEYHDNPYFPERVTSTYKLDVDVCEIVGFVWRPAGLTPVVHYAFKTTRQRINADTLQLETSEVREVDATVPLDCTADYNDYYLSKWGVMGADAYLKTGEYDCARVRGITLGASDGAVEKYCLPDYGYWAWMNIYKPDGVTVDCKYYGFDNNGNSGITMKNVSFGIESNF